MYISGTYDTRWNNDVLNPAFGALTASDFEVVQLGWQPGADPVVSVSALGVNPAIVAGGQSATGTVTLSGPAPAGGAVVALASTKPAAARMPASVTIGVGLVAASFAVTTSAVAVSTAVDLRASYDGSTKVATLTVMPPSPTVTSLRLSPSTVVGGSTSTGTVTLSARRAAGWRRRRARALEACHRRSSRHRRSGGRSGVGELRHLHDRRAGRDVGGHLGLVQRRGAQDRSVDRHTPRDVLAHAEPLDGCGRRERRGMVTLSGPAPPAGIVLTLTSSRPSQAAVPRSVTVAAGERSATFSVTTVPVTTDTTAWISGAYRGATKGATLAIKR